MHFIPALYCSAAFHSSTLCPDSVLYLVNESGGVERDSRFKESVRARVGHVCALPFMHSWRTVKRHACVPSSHS